MMEGNVMHNDALLINGHLPETVVGDVPKSNNINEKSTNESFTNSAVWTETSISTLLRLYESKLAMLTTPKKKTRIWIAISEDLKDYDVEMTPDQVRWKINALTKKYKQCIDSGQNNKFKYFKELNNIYTQYNLNCYTSECMVKKNRVQEDMSVLASAVCDIQTESKAVIKLRKNRLADKIESDRCQSKVQLEKQWLEYLKRQEEERLLKDEICERNLQLRQEKLELRKRALETRETLELRKLQLMETELEEVFKLKRVKCETVQTYFNC